MFQTRMICAAAGTSMRWQSADEEAVLLNARPCRRSVEEGAAGQMQRTDPDAGDGRVRVWP
jgi:hypothetical protein